MKTRSKAKLGDTIDLLSDEDPISPEECNHSGIRDHQIGDVGYTFEKRFNTGWFTGKVVEIRPGAANGKDRRCKYEDGDMEDMSLEELEKLQQQTRHHRKTPKTTMQPEQVTSSEFSFNEKDYNELKERYLTQKVLKNQQLPGGMTLRRTYRDRYIDVRELKFKKLRQKIDSLQKDDKDIEIYKLLSQLKEWEINPKRDALWRSLGVVDGDCVNELVDLTAEDEKVCIDVDEEEAKPYHIEPVCSASENNMRRLLDIDESDVKLDNSPNGYDESDAYRHASAPSIVISNISSEITFDHEVVDNECNIVSPEKPSSVDKKLTPEAVHSGLRICKQDSDSSCTAYLHRSAHVSTISDAVDSDITNSTKSITYDQPKSTGPKPDFIKSISSLTQKIRDTTSDEKPDCVNSAEKDNDICSIKLTLNAMKALQKHMISHARSVLIDDYKHLEELYLIPKVQDKSKLASGMVIRKQRRERHIDQPTPRFKKLKRRIDSLLKERKEHEVHLILCQLHQWENDPNQNSIWHGLDGENEKNGEMLVDLTNDTDEDNHCGAGAKKEIKVKRDANKAVTSSKPEHIDCIGDKKFETRQTMKSKHPHEDDFCSSNSSSSSDWCFNSLQGSKLCRSSYPEITEEAAMDMVETKEQCDDNAFDIQSLKMRLPKPQPSNTSKLPFEAFKHGKDLPPSAPVTKIEFKCDPCESIISSISDASRSNVSLPTNCRQSKRAGLDLLATTADTFGKDKKTPFMKQLTGNKDYTTSNTTEDYNHLADGWRTQGKKRRKGEWTPNGHITGKWKAPQWKDGDLADQIKPATCKKILLPILERLVNDFIKRSVPHHKAEEHPPSPPAQLIDIVCPFYLKPDFALLESAHYALETLLPEGDCESFDVVRISRRYCNHWRPKQTRVILLAESHAATDRYSARHKTLDESIMPQSRYRGPREFLSLVYCLAYGENESMVEPIANNKGTPQFWSLLAACSRGVNYIPPGVSGSKQTASRFAADILKGGGLKVEDRLNAKLGVLEDLRERGIWLIDTSIFGWYIAQPQKYKRSSVSNEVHRMQKEISLPTKQNTIFDTIKRPPGELKSPSLVLSYELFTKHLIREIAEEGHLELVIPIGRDVERAITRQKLEEAVCVPGIQNHARVVNAFPAPNAWIPGGYGLFHAKLADLIHSVAPRRDTILIRTPLKVECADRIIGDDDDVKTNSALPNPTKCPSLPPLTG